MTLQPVSLRLAEAAGQTQALAAPQAATETIAPEKIEARGDAVEVQASTPSAVIAPEMEAAALREAPVVPASKPFVPDAQVNDALQQSIQRAGTSLLDTSDFQVAKAAGQPPLTVGLLLNTADPGLEWEGMDTLRGLSRANAASERPAVIDAEFVRPERGVHPLRRWREKQAGSNEIEARRNMLHAVDLGKWDGQSHVHIDAQGRVTVGARSPTGESEAPDLGRFEQMLVSQMRDHPHSAHVVYALGHGLPGSLTADVAPEAFAGTLRNATDATGQDIHTLVLTSCLTGNLENLSYLPRSVKSVVAPEIDADLIRRARPEDSEHAILLGESLEPMQQAGARPRDMAAAVVERSAQGYRDTDNHLVAYDMDRFHEHLLPALDALGNSLQTDLKGGKMTSAVQAAMQKAPVVDGDARDLGGFLRALDSEGVSEATRTHARAALQALHETVVRQADTDKDRQLSGMSFNSWAYRDITFEDDRRIRPVLDAPLPGGWVGFLMEYQNQVLPPTE